MTTSNLFTTAFSPNDQESEIMLKCAENIMGHFNRLIEHEGKVKYTSNREILDSMINAIEASSFRVAV